MNESTFTALNELRKDPHLTLRALAERASVSLGKASSIVKELASQGLIDENRAITDAGTAALAPYKVDNALILAAGKSSRFVPFCYDTPKGLLTCKGEVLIERQIEQLRAAGVDDIVIVVGYMMEQFAYLEEKYGATLVVNDEYALRNTHSSILAAADYLKNTYICSSDDYFTENVFDAYVYDSYYATVFMAGETMERGVITDKNGLIVDTQKPSLDQWVMFGHVYWSAEFSKKIVGYIRDEYDRVDVADWYWEWFYVEHLDELPLYARRYADGVIYEFDSVADICAFDADFLKTTQSEAIDHICETLGCQPMDIRNFQAINIGLTNSSFSFAAPGGAYIYRQPKAQSRDIDRVLEKRIIELVSPLGISDECVAISERGWKLSKFIEGAEDYRADSFLDMLDLARILQRLHGEIDESDLEGMPEFDYAAKTASCYEDILACGAGSAFSREYASLLERTSALDAFIKEHPFQKTLCHNDIYDYNILRTPHRLYLIDWEYGTAGDAGFDICKLFSLAFFKELYEIEAACSLYFNRKPTSEETAHLLACAALSYYWWFLWAVLMEHKGTDMRGNILLWLRKARHYESLIETALAGKEA